MFHPLRELFEMYSCAQLPLIAENGSKHCILADFDPFCAVLGHISVFVALVYPVVSLYIGLLRGCKRRQACLYYLFRRQQESEVHFKSGGSEFCQKGSKNFFFDPPEANICRYSIAYPYTVRGQIMPKNAQIWVKTENFDFFCPLGPPGC